MGQYRPDYILRLYFWVRAGLSRGKALMVDGMPQIPGNPGTPAHMQARLADLAWYAQDLTAEERSIMELRLLGFGGVDNSYRYLFSAEDLELDEVPTGQRHPSDQRCFEVRGTRVRPPTLKEIAARLGLAAGEVSKLINQARAKVALRIQQKSPDHLWQEE
jgi:hypothetical protein